MVNWELKGCCKHDRNLYCCDPCGENPDIVFGFNLEKLWRTILLTPFKLITVFLHKANHAIACKLTCGHVFSNTHTEKFHQEIFGGSETNSTLITDKSLLSILLKQASSVKRGIMEDLGENNPTSQQLVMEVNGLPPHLYHISDPDITARTKVLGAISALIWNNKPGITAFRLKNGYAILRDALSTESVMFQREALNLIQYLLRENSSDCNIVTEFGFPRIMMHLTSSDDAEVREAALRGLLVLARDEGGNSGQLVKNDDKLKQVLQERIEGISAMAPEDLSAAWEERQLVDSLWNACYNKPSSLREKGLLVLPGEEDAPAPDVAIEAPPATGSQIHQSVCLSK